MSENFNDIGWYSREELLDLGFVNVGNDVHVSRKASIYNMKDSELGNHIKIDDFCFLLGKIHVGNYVHIAPFCLLVGGEEGIYLKDYAGLSSRVSIYACSDDYSGEFMTNPTIPSQYTNVCAAKVIVEKHAIIGASSVILPGAIIGAGCSCGALSMINKSLSPWSINVGIPCKQIARRSKQLLEIEKELAAQQSREIQIGEERCFYRKVTEDSVDNFAVVSQDKNPIHIDEEAAKNSIFGRRIAHGMLIGSFISSVIGNNFPGNGTIYLSQNLKFLKPIYIGDDICIKIRVKNIYKKDKACLETLVLDTMQEICIAGEATVKLPYKTATVM